MKLIQCSKGHYYDSDKNKECPYCGTGAGAQSQVTVPLHQAGEMKEEKEPEVQEFSRTAEEAPGMEAVEQGAEQWRAPASREGAYQAAAWAMPEDDNRTVGYYSRTMGTEPVVGWLVAIEGNYFGESFRLKAGRNFVGRSPEMDVQLSMDNSVSGQKHAIIIYEPGARKFIAQPGDSRELFYLNDEVVLNNVVLNAYDVLTVGETKLVFLPLCGERFGWEDVREKKD